MIQRISQYAILEIFDNPLFSSYFHELLIS